MSIIELAVDGGNAAARINCEDPGKLGEGSSIEEAVGAWVIKNQKQLGLKLTFFADGHPAIEAAASVLYGPGSTGSYMVMGLIEELVEERCAKMGLERDTEELIEFTKMCVEDEEWKVYESKSKTEAREWVLAYIEKLIIGEPEPPDDN